MRLLSLIEDKVRFEICHNKRIYYIVINFYMFRNKHFLSWKCNEKVNMAPNLVLVMLQSFVKKTSFSKSKYKNHFLFEITNSIKSMVILQSRNVIIIKFPRPYI